MRLADANVAGAGLVGMGLDDASLVANVAIIGRTATTSSFATTSAATIGSALDAAAMATYAMVRAVTAATKAFGAVVPATAPLAVYVAVTRPTGTLDEAIGEMSIV